MSEQVRSFRIGIDLMGADRPPEFIFSAATTLAADFYKNISIQFFANKVLYTERPNCSFSLCPEVIEMTDNPLTAIREKKNSSLVIGLTMLKKGELDAFISCANTGALIAGSRAYIDTINNVTRPALVCEFPSHAGPVAMLDVGGSVESSAMLLREFAHLGAAYATAVLSIPLPKVALLNIGQESAKGTDALKEAWKLLQEEPKSGFTFVGNKEPHDVFQRQADVFVTSGFAGNIFVKTAEAVSSFILEMAKKSHPTLKPHEIIQEGRGAYLIGLQKPICKCHGLASNHAIQRALEQTKTLLETSAFSKIEQLFSSN